MRAHLLNFQNAPRLICRKYATRSPLSSQFGAGVQFTLNELEIQLL